MSAVPHGAENAHDPTAAPAAVPAGGKPVLRAVEGQRRMEAPTHDARNNPFTPEQRDALAHLHGPLLVLAGAGAGKTNTMTERTAYLVESGTAFPDEILSITFTNKAAIEMQERLAKRLGAAYANRVTIGTFHAVCGKMLRNKAELIGRATDFGICNDADKERILKRYLEGNPTDSLGKELTDEGRIDYTAIVPLRDCKDAIGKAKNLGLTPDDLLRTTPEITAAFPKIGLRERRIVVDAWKYYAEELADTNKVDFDDMLVFAVQLLRDHPAVLRSYQEKWKFIQVDEFQDTNTVQYEFLKLLAGGHRNLAVVGDDDQLVYSWRQAELKNILGFSEEFDGSRVVYLNRNFRCSPPIVEAANRLIEHNTVRHPKRMIAAAPDTDEHGHPWPNVILKEHASGEDEIDWIVSQIARFREHFAANGIPGRELAVLSRFHAPVNTALEKRLTAEQIPFRMMSGRSFYDQKEVKAALAHLALLINPHDEESLGWALEHGRAGIGPATVAKVVIFARAASCDLLTACTRMDRLPGLQAQQVKSLATFGEEMLKLAAASSKLTLDEVLYQAVHMPGGIIAMLRKKSKLRELTQVDEIIAALRTYERETENPTATDFLARTSLAGAGEKVSGISDDDKLVVSTIHSVKGLEFRVVIIAGMEEGMLPSSFAVETPEIEEERRLAYVAITRAKRCLALSWARTRQNKHGTVEQRQASRFVSEAMGQDLKTLLAPTVRTQA